MKKVFLLTAALVLAACSSKTTDGTKDQSVSNETTEVSEVCDGIAGIICSKETDFCFHEEGVCLTITDAQGVCKPKPEACPQIYMPVCGCDGKTYSNDCTAHAAGTSVASQGECPAAE